MEGRKQFTFYRSYYEAIVDLPKKDQTSVILAICAYALDEKEPNLTGTASAIFKLVKPTLDSSKKKSDNGKAGGSAKQTASKMEANQKQTVREKENEKEKEKENELEIENECLRKDKKKRFVPPTLEEVRQYCKERNNGVDAKKFFDYFEESDWYDSKGQKVRNWKQKVITWERNAKQPSATKTDKLAYLRKSIQEDYENDRNRSETVRLLDEHVVVEL